MKAIIPIVIIGGVAVALAIGAGRSLNRGDDTEASSKVQKETQNEAAQQAGARHYEHLDRVRMGADTPSQEKEYTGFRLSFNKENRTPNWVSWELLGSEAESTSQSRSNNFWQDEDIYGCPTKQDYTRSGYDRGHMCPSADQKWSSDAMNDCFVMANMCPQANALNTGAWKTLENKERAWALRDSAIVIVAGPIYYSNDTKRIGETGVRVPGAFFKVMVAPYASEPRGIAFIYPNMSAPGNMQNYVTTIDEVEKMTGYDFFYKLPDEIEDKIESTSSFTAWNRRD